MLHKIILFIKIRQNKNGPSLPKFNLPKWIDQMKAMRSVCALTLWMLRWSVLFDNIYRLKDGVNSTRRVGYDWECGVFSVNMNETCQKENTSVLKWKTRWRRLFMFFFKAFIPDSWVRGKKGKRGRTRWGYFLLFSSCVPLFLLFLPPRHSFLIYRKTASGQMGIKLHSPFTCTSLCN